MDYFRLPRGILKGTTTIETLDMHTGGEPLRIIRSGIPPIPGDSIMEKVSYFRTHFDGLRKSLMWEPRGHADMYGAVITGPVRAGSDFGVFFLHNEGYSSMCGHAIIALTRLAAMNALEMNQMDRNLSLSIDVPAGTVRAMGQIRGGKVVRVSFENVPSFVSHRDVPVILAGFPEFSVDIAFGGAFYAILEMPEGMIMSPEHAGEWIQLGERIKDYLMGSLAIKHPFDDALSFLYGVIFTGPAFIPVNHSRNICVFADRELDRSATGTGVSARAALLAAQNMLETGREIQIESITGSTMGVSIKTKIPYGPYEAVVPEVSGDAWITGQHRFIMDPKDPFQEGFFIR